MEKEKNKLFRFLKVKVFNKEHLSNFLELLLFLLFVGGVIFGIWVFMYLGAYLFKYMLTLVTPAVIITTSQGLELMICTLGIVFLVTCNVLAVKALYRCIKYIKKEYKNFV